MIICHNFLVKFLIFFTLILNLHSVCCKSVGDVPNPSYTVTNFDFSKFLDITSYLEVPLSPECKYLIESFSTELTNYIHCTITISDSFHVCSSCLSHFRNLEKTYKNLTKEIEKCPSGFSSSKKYSLIQSYYANYEKLWETNHCDKCFAKTPNDDVISEDVMHIFTLVNDFENCTDMNKSSNGSAICLRCQTIYSNVNKYYEKMLIKYKENVCYDVINVVNLVRQFWNVHHCLHTVNYHFDILLIGISIIIVSVIFYVVGRLFCVAKHTQIVKQKRLVESFRDSVNVSERTPILGPRVN